MAITVESRVILSQGGYGVNVPIGGVNTDVMLVGDDGGTATVQITGTLRLVTGAAAGKYLTSDASGNASWVTITALTDPMTTRGDIIVRNASNVTARLPVGTNGYFLKSDGTDVSWSAVTASVATAVTIANEATDTTCFPLFATAATGDLGPKSNSGLTFNSNTGLLTSTSLACTNFTLGGTAITASGAEINFVDGVTSNVQLQLDGKQQFHGVESAGALSFDNTTHILTIAAATNTYWYLGTKYTTSSAITCDLDSYITLTTRTLYYVYFDDASGTLKASTSFWDLYTRVPVATVFWNGSAGATIKETHGHKRDPGWHTNAHLTIGCRYVNNGGLNQTNPTTANDALLQIEPGTLYDEDLALAIAQSTTMRGWYQFSASVYTFADYALPYLGTSGAPVYLDTDTYALTTFASNRFACYWVYGCGDISRSIYVIPSAVSTPYTTAALARAETPPSLIGLNISQEMKLLYRWIYAGDGQYQEGADYRNASSLPGGGAAATAAASVTFAPTGNIIATNVQSAIEELDTEKAAVGQTFYIGSTQVAINRASASLALTGITSIDGSAASAATLTTPRAIYGNNFDGSAALTQVIASTYGGTGNGFVKFSGPTTAEKTFTLPDSNATLLYSGGALGTPASGTLTSCTGLPVAGIVASTSTALGVGSIELGHASDTSITRVSAGVAAIEGKNIALNGTSEVHTIGTIELGAASDTTIARVSAGVISVEGVTIPTISSINTLTNKRITRRTVTTTSTATLTIDSDSYDRATLTAQAEALTIAAPTGTPTDGQQLRIRITSDATPRAYTWNAIWRVVGVTLPTTSTASKTNYIMAEYNSTAVKWDVLAVGVEA